MRDVVKWFVLAVDIVAMFGMVAGILMHSGRGGGLSDMFGGAAGASLGSTAAERNLDRITIVTALVFVFSTVSLGLLLD